MIKSSGEVFFFELVSQLFDPVVGEPENPDVHDFETFGHVPEPRNKYILSSETRGYFNQIKKSKIVLKIKMLGLLFVANGGEKKRRKNRRFV